MVLGICLAQMTWGKQKHALLIMIGQYPANSGWPALHANNDAQILAQTLQKQGFGQIIVLKDQQATAANIRAACTNLLTSLHTGDQVVVAFSGHGQQVFDWSNDEKDQLDEALVAYDSPRRANPNTYKGDKHIIDDEIGFFVQQAKARLGANGHVLMLLDCCHAGTGARTNAQARLRGGAAPIAPPLDPLPDIGSGFKEVENNTRGGEAVFVLLAGAAATQQNFEVKNNAGEAFGALSYSFCEALQYLHPKDTYQVLFDKIALILAQKAPFQTPTIEGNAEAVVFAGQLVPATAAFEGILEKSTAYCRRVRLAAGQLAGVFANAVFGFVPKTAARGDTLPPVVRGTVIESGVFGAIVELDNPVPLSVLQELHPVEIEHAWGATSVGVYWGDFQNKLLQKQLEQMLQHYPLLVRVPAHQATYELFQKSDSCVVLHSATQIRASQVLVNEHTASDVAETLRTLAQAAILRPIEICNPKFEKLTVQLKQLNAPTNTALPQVRVGVPTTLLLHNPNDTPVFVAIADIQPNGIINVLLPNVNSGLPEFELAAHETRQLDLRVSPPLGTEVYKIFLTPTFLDVGALISSRGDAPLAHPLQKLFQKTYRGQTPNLLNINQLLVSSYVFQLID